MTSASTEDQIAAWERFADAKRRADRTLQIDDGIAAIAAWKEFASLFLPEDRQMPWTTRPTKVSILPAHKTRASGERRR